MGLIANCTVDIQESTATHYSEIRGELKKAGTPIPSNDIWIAALCRERRTPLFSQERHSDLINGLRRVGWKE